VVGYTESGMPVMEEVRPGVWAIGGYSGTGNVVGAIAGRVVAELVVDGHSGDAWMFRS
jgi:glycine/D-amino acid oxidase-like deaminating enzyme